MDEAKHSDSFISHRPLATNYAFIQRHGIEEFARHAIAKMDLLSCLLNDYDDGRSKSFYCTACQLLPPDSLKVALAQAKDEMSEGADAKDRARLLRTAISRQADALGIDLKLRR